MKSLETAWTNFLLGCGNCNSCKGKRNIKLEDYLWPDRDNTLRAFFYDQSGRVNTRPKLRRANRTKAESTIALVGLDRIPGNSNKRKRPTKADLRWRRRQEAYDLARRLYADLQQQDTPIVRNLIVETAFGRGMFSIWMQIFESDPDMRNRLIERFVGTAINCFDPHSKAAIKRPGGNI
jgi:hypothetical protein